MILTIDIGNTNITFGVFDEEKLILVSRLATERNRTGDQYAFEFLNIFKMNEIPVARLHGAIISSVVPELNRAVGAAVEKVCGFPAMLLGPGVKTGLNILIDDPAQLGGDLAAGAVGAVAKYPLPAFVVDLGTATKVYVIDENKGYQGGTIAPGVEISMKALTDRASLLPSFPLNPPVKACGTNTIESLQAGVVFGTADMIDGIIARLEAERGKPACIIATGGLASYIVEVCTHSMIYDADLILYGLKAIYDKNQKKS